MDEIVKIEVADQAVALPVDKKTLGEFISALLGQPQSLEREFVEPFSANHQWFLHFFSLVLQRIQQQNSPEPIAFTATIKYRNNIERKITSWEAFEHFSETQNIVSIGVKFNLALLIRFPGKLAPERQEIIIAFDAREQQVGMIESLLARGRTTNSILLEIRHTERTWADDILRLVETELASIQTTESSLKKRLRKFFIPLASFSFPVMVLASSTYSWWASRGNNDLVTAKVLALAEGGKEDMHSLHKKIDLLLAQTQDISLSKFAEMPAIIYSMVVAIVLILGGVFLARPNPSFVVLSQAAEKNRKESLEKQRRKSLWLFLSMIGSIVLGVVGNFVYDRIK